VNLNCVNTIGHIQTLILPNDTSVAERHTNTRGVRDKSTLDESLKPVY